MGCLVLYDQALADFPLFLPVPRIPQQRALIGRLHLVLYSVITWMDFFGMRDLLYSICYDVP